MDVIVKAADGSYVLTDLLGRPMGSVVRDGASQFTIESLGLAAETMRGMKHGPFASLDDALAEIEKHTRGVCRREAADEHNTHENAGDDQDGNEEAERRRDPSTGL